MEAPVCLIENRRNRLHASPEALRLLSEIRKPVVVMSIVGLYRTGKSYLMNKLAGKNSDAKMKAKAKELEEEVHKQKQEMLQQKIEDERKSHELNHQKLREKLEEEKKKILEEQEKMIQNKLKEQKSFLEEGFAQEASQLNEKINELKNKKEEVEHESWISSRLGDLGEFFVDNIIEPVVDNIIEPVVEWFEDLLQSD